MPRRRDVFLLPATPRQPRRPAELANMRGHICALQVRAPRNHGRAAQTAARLSHASHPPPPPHRSQRPPPPCSIANCTTEFPGKRESDIGEGIAACGCMTPGCVRCPLGGACGARLARVAEGGGRRACNCTRAPHPLWEVALSRILLHPTPPHPVYILDSELQSETIAACGDGIGAVVVAACRTPNTEAAPVCQAMANNTM